MEVEHVETTEKVIVVRFRGVLYRRYPKSKRYSDRVYFRCGTSDRQRGRWYLHRDVWVATNGPLPDGWDVHHKDGDATNNVPENLDALPDADHRRHHVPDMRQRKVIEYKAMTKAKRGSMLKAAANWHRSEEGRAWHRKHAHQLHANAVTVSRDCQLCGATYTVKGSSTQWSKFCSNKCKAAARRKSGVDNEPRACHCGKQFTVSRYAKTRSCSRRCARKL